VRLRLVQDGRKLREGFDEARRARLVHGDHGIPSVEARAAF
jgi:hypothetical protein